MNTKFYEARIGEDGLVTLSPPDGEDGGIRTGKLGRVSRWGVFWPRDPRAKKLEIRKVKRRNNPEKDGEYKMHIEYFTNVAGMNGGKLIFDDKVTGKKWRKLLKALSHKENGRGTRTPPNLAISEAMEEIGFPDLLNKIDENEPLPHARYATEVLYPETGRIHLCSVDSSNRCILYTRNSVNNYLQFTEFIEEKVENPLAAEGAQAEPMVAESETGGTGNLLHEMDSSSSTEQETGGGKKTKKRKRKTKKRKTKKRKTKKRKGRKRSTKNLKSKRKNKKYTKRRR